MNYPTHIALVKISALNDRLIPLGIACLQAYLKAHNMPVKVYNFRGDTYSLPKTVIDPLIQQKPPNLIVNHQDFPILLSLISVILSDKDLELNEGVFSDLFKDYASRVLESPEESKSRYDKIVNFAKICGSTLREYDKIGFSVDYLNVVETVVMSCYLKNANPKLKIIWGGPAITQSHEAFKLLLLKNACDGLVVGEGEQPALEFALGKDLNAVKGVISIKQGTKNEFVYSPGIQLDLDTLPTPDYTDLPLDTYYRIASVYRSRGCKNRCKFCAEWKLFGPKFRTRSIEKVINDISEILKKYDPKYLIFGESLINDDLDYFEKLCDAMIEKKFPVRMGTHFRANITPDLARKAREAGFDDAWVGIEALTENVLQNMNKGTSTNQNIETIKNFTNAGINVLAMLVVGFGCLEEEQKNCQNLIEIMNSFSNKTIFDKEGREHALSMQWRPAPLYLVPGSLDYEDRKNICAWSWMPLFISHSNREALKLLRQELSDIPYEFARSIPDGIVGSILKKIQNADRQARFAIGGIAAHAIKEVAETRRKSLKSRKLTRVGVATQRYDVI